MITITWHLLLLILAALFSFCYAVTRDARRGPAGSMRGFAVTVWAVGVIILTLIYGGFVWW